MVAFSLSLILISSSIIGRTLFAPDTPCCMAIFKVAKDLTGWYANIIAARNEKKLLTSSSLLKINFEAK